MGFRTGLVDRIVERTLQDPRQSGLDPAAARPAWLNAHAWTAICCGIILLLVTYGYTAEKSFAHDASHEVGFALIVAVLIWIIFEVASKEGSDKTWNDRIDRISKNVFFGVLGRDLSPGIITEARFVALDHSFERSDLHVTYHLADATYTDRSGQPQSFVVLRATTRFRIRNISDRQAVYPVGVGLPNPLINEMKTYCRVDKVCIRNGEDVDDLAPLLAAANAKLQEDLVNDGSYQVNFAAKDIVLKPGDDREIILEYTMAKEDEDTEILQTRYPTQLADRHPRGYGRAETLDQGPFHPSAEPGYRRLRRAIWDLRLSAGEIHPAVPGLRHMVEKKTCGVNQPPGFELTRWNVRLRSAR